MTWMMRHHWLTRTATEKDTGRTHACHCPWYTRLWFLVTGR